MFLYLRIFLAFLHFFVLKDFCVFFAPAEKCTKILKYKNMQKSRKILKYKNMQKSRKMLKYKQKIEKCSSAKCRKQHINIQSCARFVGLMGGSQVGRGEDFGAKRRMFLGSRVGRGWVVGVAAGPRAGRRRVVGGSRVLFAAVVVRARVWSVCVFHGWVAGGSWGAFLLRSADFCWSWVSRRRVADRIRARSAAVFEVVGGLRAGRGWVVGRVLARSAYFLN
jgi:hypothetical protein